MRNKITIDGMHCASCAANVEKSLKKIQGVKEVNVNVILGLAFVESDGVSSEDLKKAVKNAGFVPKEIEAV